MAQLACSRQARFQLKLKLQVGPECGNNTNKKKNPHLNFLKATVLGDKEQGVGIKDKG